MISNAPAAIAVSPISLTLMMVAKTTSLRAKTPAAIRTMPRRAEPRMGEDRELDAGPAVDRLSCTLPIRVVTGTLGSVASSLQRRYPHETLSRSPGCLLSCEWN